MSTTTAPSVVGAAIDRIAARPPIERRSAFFEELRKLDPLSRERWELAEFGRRMFAPGPYYSSEWEALQGIVYSRRKPKPGEEARLAEHAAARVVVEECRQEWLLAKGEADRARDWAKRSNTHRAEDMARYEAARIAAAEAADLERDARERFADAQANEIRLRPFQEERVAAAGRNWLRWLRRDGGEK